MWQTWVWGRPAGSWELGASGWASCHTPSLPAYLGCGLHPVTDRQVGLSSVTRVTGLVSGRAGV